MANSFVNFPTALQGLLQQGFLAREMEEGLDSILAYRGLVIQETFPGRIGETITKTRKGRRAPTTTPLDPTTIGANLDNSLSVSTSPFSIEQYSFTLAEYAQTLDLNLMQDAAGIADQFIANARNNGVQAAQSLERICRKKLFGAYLSGNTRVITVPGNTVLAPDGTANPASIANAASGTVNVDDVRGFLTTIINGTPSAPTVANPIGVTITTVAGVIVTGVIEAAALAYTYEAAKSALNVTTSPDAVPGTITIKNNSGATWTITVGDTIVANNAPVIFRPSGRVNQVQLVGADTLSLAICMDAVAYMRDNGVPPMADGTFHIILDNTSMRQLFADPDFKTAYAGRQETPEFKNADIVRLLGMTFIPTTEAYVQNQMTAASSSDPPAITGTRIRRPIICGAESIIQANFEGMETWLAQRGFDRSDSTIVLVDSVLQIVREPLDRLQQIVAMSWTWIGDFAVPTDITADSTIIPTASNALFKRCVVIEHAG